MISRSFRPLYDDIAEGFYQLLEVIIDAREQNSAVHCLKVVLDRVHLIGLGILRAQKLIKPS